MAASTQDASTLNVSTSRLQRMAANHRRAGNISTGIIAPIILPDIAVPTTALDDAGDKLRIAYFEPGFYLMDLTIRWEGDADTDVSPALVNDLILQDADGNEDTLPLISGSTAGQAANGGDRLDDGMAGTWLGARYLTLKTTTAAATAAAVDLRLVITVSRGAIAMGQSRVPHFQEL